MVEWRPAGDLDGAAAAREAAARYGPDRQRSPQLSGAWTSRSRPTRATAPGSATAPWRCS